jgi:hypothetical protein
MFAFLETLDRRWVFLMMGLAIAIPILFPFPFTYKPSVLAQSVFEIRTSRSQRHLGQQPHRVDQALVLSGRNQSTLGGAHGGRGHVWRSRTTAD